MQQQHQQPAFVETDFTVPITALDSSPPRCYSGSRDTARSAHHSGPASRRAASHAPAAPYPQQRRDVLHMGSPFTHQPAAYLLFPATNPSSSRSRQLVGTTPGPAKAPSQSPAVSSHPHYRPIQPKPAANPLQYVSGSLLRGLPASRVTSGSRVTAPTFPGWRPGTASVLNVPRLPAAAHGSRPLPAAHRSSAGGLVGDRGCLPSSGVGAALSLTIDDQAPLDCSRKTVELDVATVLNLTTSGHAGANGSRLLDPPKDVGPAISEASLTASECQCLPPKLKRGRATSDDVEGHRDMSLYDLEAAKPALAPSGGQTLDLGGQAGDLVITFGNLGCTAARKVGDTNASNVTLDDLWDTKPVSSVAPSQGETLALVVTSGDSGCESVSKIGEPNATLNDLEDRKAVLPDFTASDRRDEEMTSADLEETNTEQVTEVNTDSQWKDSLPSPVSEGLLFVFYKPKLRRILVDT